jgi:hypothetical protein
MQISEKRTGLSVSTNEDISMKNSLLSSVAALALIIGTGSVFAQGTGMKEAPAAAAPKADSASPSPKAESTAPSPKAESASPTNSPKGSSAETAPPAGAKTGATAQDKGEPKGSKAANDSKADTKPSSAATTPSTNSASKDAKNPAADSKAAATDTKPSSAATTPSTNSASKDAKNPAADSKAAGTDTKAGGSNTTGNAATSATAAPPAEKRTQIVSAIKQEKVEEVTNVNFNISVGTAVPSSVRYHPLPPRIVEIYPEWRGYDFIVVRGKYIILRPQTHEIVYIIEG